MILVDANLLLYAYNPSFERHALALRWLEELLSKPEPVGLAWLTILAFLRIGTSPRAFEYPLATDEAVPIVSSWLAQPMVTVLEPGERHWMILTDLLSRTQARGPAVMDAHLAALAIEHGATLCTSDRDFARFPGLQIINPLARDE
ncbi:MAG: type II toxin-antitoxin system VapC family toxin [Armatimonadetes bacterium]|nr:type II toxin-antitoxin system VapC family toxin [Armatimonadota bacterium]